MAANIGEMFYYGEVPWHGQGVHLAHPATMEEAVLAGGLDWEVEKVPLQTKEDPPSPVGTRFAIVRTDRPQGHPQRVIGVAHREFTPLQNREGIRIFDSIFGKGRRVYHTGGYLGSGEVIWLLAALPKTITVKKGDEVKTYALFTNSHNGSVSIDIRLTTVRVVCQNTLALALNKKDKNTVFKRAHHGTYQDLQVQVEAFFEKTLKAVDDLDGTYKAMMERKFDDDRIKGYVESLLPMPDRPEGAEINARVAGAYEARVRKVKTARQGVVWLSANGMGTDLTGVKGSLWGTLNAVIEYIDHYGYGEDISISSTLLGSGAALKRRAFDLAVQCLRP